MKLKQIQLTQVKDIQVKLRESRAEVEVLKEMVKSANHECKAKEIDI